MRLIPLTRGQWAVVDDADFEWLSQWSWCACWSKYTKSFYARRGVSVGHGKSRTMSMHRQILGLEIGEKQWGDHVSGNTLDNRRNNLRICTPRQNAFNTRCTTGRPKGITKRGSKWRAQIVANGKKISLGTHDTAELAHAAYCAAAITHHGEFARLS
jgi:hypothetical protein